MIKAGILGCGKIADQHAEQISKIPDSELVAVCDNEPLMAQQLFDRYDASKYHTDVDEFLTSSDLDVVHITTPPQSHLDLALKCFEAGCHVYLEKPFALNTEDTISIIDRAQEKGLKVTAGHNGQFSHASTRMRKLVSEGFLGGTPLHMESHFGYSFGDVNYAKALLGDRNHWARDLPGRLLHNIISHGVCRIAEFLDTENPHVVAYGYSSPLLQSIDETDIIDELRVIISNGTNTTAYFTFSSQMVPILHQFRVYGSTGSIMVDEDDQTVIKLKGTSYKSYLSQFVPPLERSGQYMKNFAGHIGKFLRYDFHSGRGMRVLTETFYKSIRDDDPVPIPYREIILTSAIMEKIFDQIYSQEESA